MVKYTAKVKRGMRLHFLVVAAALTDETTVRGIMRSWTAAEENDFLAFTEYATQELATIGYMAPPLDTKQAGA